MQTWSLVLSVIGALAWLPIVLTPIINSNRGISASFLEFRILTNGVGVSAVTNERKSGVLFLMVVNLFTRNYDFYPTSISGEFKTKDNHSYLAELLDFSTITSNSEGGTKTTFDVPMEMEFNISRTIKNNTDNVKLISFIVEGAQFSTLSEIDEIVLTLCSERNRKKKLRFYAKDFPRFNSTRIIDKYEKAVE